MPPARPDRRPGRLAPPPLPWPLLLAPPIPRPTSDAHRCQKEAGRKRRQGCQQARAGRLQAAGWGLPAMTVGRGSSCRLSRHQGGSSQSWISGSSVRATHPPGQPLGAYVLYIYPSAAGPRRRREGIAAAIHAAPGARRDAPRRRGPLQAQRCPAPASDARPAPQPTPGRRRAAPTARRGRRRRRPAAALVRSALPCSSLLSARPRAPPPVPRSPPSRPGRGWQTWRTPRCCP